jgi:hypothetical protein
VSTPWLISERTMASAVLTVSGTKADYPPVAGEAGQAPIVFSNQ